MKQLFSDKRLLNYQQRINRLRCFTIIFLLLLVLPVSMIFYIGFNQFEKDQLTQYQRQTEKVTNQINKRLFKRGALWNSITTSEFDYYQHVYNPVSQQLTQALSPLATPEYYERISGLVGYFQVDRQGQFNSPVWPSAIDSQIDTSSTKKTMQPELTKRKNIAIKLYNITSNSNELQNIITQGLPGKIEKFQLVKDVTDHLIFYRIVTVNDQTKLQGYVLDRNIYLNEYIARVLNMVRFESSITLTLESPQPSVQKHYFFYSENADNQTEITQPQQFDKKFNQLLISNHDLLRPFSGYSITYSTSSLQLSSAAIYSGGLMVILITAIVFGCYGFYRIGVKQLKLAEQRLNFVSSVSHELKTPLTSIRLYAEMLKTGMVLSDKHQNDYYEFIFSESERLSRLIDNILQLAKLSQPQHCVNPEYTKISILTDIIRSKVSSLVDKSDFQLNIVCTVEEPDQTMLLVDIDAFAQVVINITDNAIKFFDSDKIQDSHRQKIDFVFSPDPKVKDHIQLMIRDYGSGISPEQENKLFDLFYRGGSELTRSTQGTGIGLALVNELVLAQQGSITVQRMTPGLAMNMSFQCEWPSQVATQQNEDPLSQT